MSATDAPTGDPGGSVDELTELALASITKVLDSATATDIGEIQSLLLQRMAVAGALFPSRIPAPANITEVGGYLNLIEDDAVLRGQALAAALGVAGPNPPVGFTPTSPPLFFAEQPNDRPEGPWQAAIPVSVGIRSDFAPALDAARTALHELGGTLPLLGRSPVLPPATGPVPGEDEQLAPIGRQLRIVPATGLDDPTADPVVVATPDAGGDLQVLSRQVDPDAPDAELVSEETWDAFRCDETSCAQESVTARLIPLAPVLAPAGWHHTIEPPTSVQSGGGWDRWTNLTGLVAGETTYGSELALLHTPDAVAASPVRDLVTHVFDGEVFRAP